MDISSISNINNITKNNLSGISTGNEDTESTFASILDSAINLIDETNSLQNTSSDITMAYLQGDSNVNIEDVLIAEQKASVALQFTIELRNSVLKAYDEIMRMQI